MDAINHRGVSSGVAHMFHPHIHTHSHRFMPRMPCVMLPSNDLSHRVYNHEEERREKKIAMLLNKILLSY